MQWSKVKWHKEEYLSTKYYTNKKLRMSNENSTTTEVILGAAYSNFKSAMSPSRFVAGRKACRYQMLIRGRKSKDIQWKTKD
jgi:hypothetical protein